MHEIKTYPFFYFHVLAPPDQNGFAENSEHRDIEKDISICIPPKVSHT